MSDAEKPLELPAHQVALAQAINRFGHLVVSRDLDPDRAADLTDLLDKTSAALESEPRVGVKENMLRRNRIARFIEEGQWPPAPPSGSQMEFDPVSAVGGELNPFTIGARYYRDGEEAVGRVTFGPCFEGPPGRVHGGMICSVFDEVLGSVFRATGTASAFTGEISVRFEQPAPLEMALEFRARRVGSKGRKQFLEAEATGPEGRFATATATFIEMSPEHFPSTDN